MADYVELARYLLVAGGSYTKAVPIGAATVVELQVVNLSGSANVAMEWSADESNWRTLKTEAAGAGITSLTTPTGMTSGWLRVGFSVDFGSPLILRAIASLFVPDIGAAGAGGPVPPAPPIG